MKSQLRAAVASKVAIIAMAVATLSLACNKKAGDAAQGPTAVVAGPFTTRPTETSIPPAPEKIARETAELFVTWAMKSATKGQKVQGVVTAVDVGGAAAPNTEVLRTDVTVPVDGEHWGNFTFKKPTAGWPAGSYRVDVIHGTEAIGSVSFRIE